MSNLTAEEIKWMRKLKKLLKDCPSKRFGFYTTGDKDITVYDKNEFNELYPDVDNIDIAPVIESAGLVFDYLCFPSNVEGLCG